MGISGERMKKVGVMVPWEDRTDYCLTSDGVLMFFEVDELDILTVEDFLQSLSKPTPDQQRAGRLLDRLKALESLT